MICKQFSIDPMGYNNFCGQNVPTIVCHRDSYDYGLGNQHADVYPWFNKFGKTMNDIRKDVKAILDGDKPEPVPTFKLLDEVKIKSGVTTWASGAGISGWVLKSLLYVRAINGHKITVSTLKSGAITGTVYDTDIELINAPVADVEDACECECECQEVEQPKEPEKKNPFNIGDMVTLSDCANNLIDGQTIPQEVYDAKCLYIHDNRDYDRVVVGLNECDAECERFYTFTIEDVELYVEQEVEDTEIIEPEQPVEPEVNHGENDDKPADGEIVEVVVHEGHQIDSPADPVQPEITEAEITPIFDFEVGEEVFINKNAKVFADGTEIPDVVKYWKPYIVESIEGDEVTIRVENSDFKYVLYAEDVEPYQAVKDDIAAGDIVTINSDAKTCDGQKISLWLKFRTWVVKSVEGDKAKIGFDLGEKYNMNAYVYIKDLKEVKPFLAKITHTETNVRNRASILSNIIDKKSEDEEVIVYGTSGLWYCLGDNRWSFILFVNKI